MKIKIIIAAFLIIAQFAGAQKFISKTGHVRFYSYTPIEEIEANNRQVVSILDIVENTIQFNLLIKSFDFQKALMQEHFNENYMESDKFPKAKFTGSIDNIKEINFQKDGIYPVKATGDLTMHGVTKNLTVDGTIEIKKGIPVVNAAFKVVPADYNIIVPSLVKEKIAKEVEVTVDVEYNN